MANFRIYGSDEDRIIDYLGFLDGCQQITKIGQLKNDTEIVGPVVTIDCRKRADLVDLARVIEVEGVFKYEADWTVFIQPGRVALARLDIEVSQPVKTNFSVIFNAFEEFYFLQHFVRKSPALYIMTDPGKLPDFLTIEYNPAGLVEGLDLLAPMLEVRAA